MRKLIDDMIAKAIAEGHANDFPPPLVEILQVLASAGAGGQPLQAFKPGDQARRDPFDHDGDGKPGGSLPKEMRDQPTAEELAAKEAAAGSAAQEGGEKEQAKPAAEPTANPEGAQSA